MVPSWQFQEKTIQTVLSEKVPPLPRHKQNIAELIADTYLLGATERNRYYYTDVVEWYLAAFKNIQNNVSYLWKT